MRRPTPLPAPHARPEADESQTAPQRGKRKGARGATKSTGGEARPADTEATPARGVTTSARSVGRSSREIDHSTRSATPSARERDSAATSTMAAGAGSDLDATEPLAPLLPLSEGRVDGGVRATPRTAVPERAATKTAGDIGTESAKQSFRAEKRVSARPNVQGDTGEVLVGLRDVWRAARERRKTLRAEVRRFTARQRRRRWMWFGGVTALVFVIAGTVGAAYSPLLAVEKITVSGTSTLDAAVLEQALADQIGAPLASVDTRSIKEALVQFPLVESYSLEARPPHDLMVRIVERTPIGYVESAAGFTLVDAAGVALSTSETADPAYPVLEITGGVGSEAFTSAGLVMRAIPESVRSQVTGVVASTPDDVTLVLGATDTSVRWGSEEDSALKSVVLETAMASRPAETVSLYDVSSPNAIVIE